MKIILRTVGFAKHSSPTTHPGLYIKTANISIIQLELCWIMKVANYEQMKEKYQPSGEGGAR